MLPAATNVFIIHEKISFRYPKSRIDLLASSKQIDSATLEPSVKEKTWVLNHRCLEVDYCVSSLRPLSPSEEEKKPQARAVSAAVGLICAAPDAF